MLSLVFPAYNEEAGLRDVVLCLMGALDEAGIVCELVLVDNGSRDGTERVIDALAQCDPRIRKVRVPVNQGYGWGILCGLRAAS